MYAIPDVSLGVLAASKLSQPASRNIVPSEAPCISHAPRDSEQRSNCHVTRDKYRAAEHASSGSAVRHFEAKLQANRHVSAVHYPMACPIGGA